MEKYAAKASGTIAKNKKLLVVILLSIFILAVGLPLGLNLISYTTAYQGAQPSFYGVSWGNQQYSSNGQSIPNGGHLTLTGTTMSFCAGQDPTTTKKYPTITGEMTSVFIPETQALSTVPSWVPSQWLQGWANLVNPPDTSKVYSWKSGSSSYEMDEWQTKWYVTLASDGSGEIRYGDNTFAPAYAGPLQIWLKLQTNEGGWYFNTTGLQRTYFAIAKLLVVNVQVVAHNPTNVQASPEVAGSTMTCFLTPFGNNQAPTDTQVLSYEGVTLNPLYFNGGVYCVINLDNFGTQMYWDWNTLGNKYQGDTIALDITVTQFVVGQWTVQDVQTPPVNYIKPSPNTGGGGAGGVFGFLTNPFTVFYLLLIVAAIFLAAIILSPAFAKAVENLFSRKKEPKEQSKG
jgi:hypothetical protein